MGSIVINSALQNIRNSELAALTIAAMKTLKIHRVKNAWEALETIIEDSHAVR